MIFVDTVHHLLVKWNWSCERITEMLIFSTLDFENFNAIIHGVSKRTCYSFEMTRVGSKVTKSCIAASFVWYSTLSWFKTNNSIKCCRNSNASANIWTNCNGSTSRSYETCISSTTSTTRSGSVVNILSSSPDIVDCVNWKSSLWNISTYKRNCSSLN